MRKTFAIIFAVLSLVACNRKPKTVEIVQKDTIYPLGFLTDTLRLVEGRVESGDSFTKMMERLGLGGQATRKLVELSDTAFNVSKIRAGSKLDAYYNADTTSRKLEYVVYIPDKVHFTVFRCADSMYVRSVTKPVELKEKYTDVTITASLWKDMVDAGADPELIVELSEVYAWTVDFFGLHEGDRFRAFYKEKVCDGESIGIGDIDYAIYNRGKFEVRAICYDQGDKGNKYWNEKGESLKKAFLKAPLKFTRVSSRFTHARKHPISGKVKPHLAVDYAAPMGTPVHALGDGVILSAGWGGGGGNTIKIRHNSVYTTAYLHLSKFAKGIKSGVRVRQGEVIGYVGSTGSSTGPHLDFRVWKNGTPVDPLKLESPSAEPIRSENKPALDSLCRYYDSRLATME